MDNLDKKIENVDKSIQHFEMMNAGADRIIRSWKHLAIALTIAIVLSNAIWGFVHGYSVYKAYQEPVEIEQSQDFPAQQQEQSIKGVK